MGGVNLGRGAGVLNPEMRRLRHYPDIRASLEPNGAAAQSTRLFFSQKELKILNRKCFCEVFFSKNITRKRPFLLL